MIESINNAIRSDDDLANRVIVKFWNYSADLRKLRGEQTPATLEDAEHVAGRHGLPGWQRVELADLVSEVQPIKHPLQRGIKAQRGIEF